MKWLSLRPSCTALLAWFFAAALCPAPALAQVPLFGPGDGAEIEKNTAAQELAPPSAAEVVAPAPSTASSSATAADPLPPPPPPPSPPASPPSVGAAKAPAHAALITKRVDTAAPGQLDDDGDELELRPRRTWYGWQTLTADGASFAALLAGGIAHSDRGSGDDDIAVLGTLSYLFTPGIIHFVHRNPGRGFASFGMRIGLPIAGGIIGAAAASGCNEYLCEGNGVAIGALLGIGGAIAIDAAVFAYDDRRPRSTAATRQLAPLLVLTHDRAIFGIGGAL